MLRPWQEKSVPHLIECLERHGAAADLSDPGVGKTYTACAVVRSLNLPTLVVAPKAVVPSWHKVATYLGTELDAMNWEMVRTGRTPYGEWKLEGRQRKERFHWNPAIKFLIGDEFHRAGGASTKNSDMFIAAKRQGIPTLILSATLADSPLEFKCAGYLLGLHNADEPQTLANFTKPPISFYSWARRHGCGPGAFSAFEFKGSAEQQAAQMAKIHAALLPERGVRVRIADLGDAFPDNEVTAELYEAGDAAKVNALYAQMADSLACLHERTEKYGESPLSKLIALRQEIELIKVPIFVSLAEDSIAQGRSVALFVNFSQTIQELRKRLKTDCFIDGSQTGEKGSRERQGCIDAFQSDRSRVIVCNGDAGGVGVSLHDVRGQYPRTSLISPGYSAKVFRQITGRIWRDDSKSKSLQRAICLAGTCEEQVAKALERKSTRLEALNDADFMPG